MPRIGIYLLFFFSGISGLIYQVVWVRQFGNIFGNTIYSASLVTAVFMFGLGIGGYLSGLWGDRKYRVEPDSLLRGYGYFEVGIAIFGLVIAILLPRVEPISASISSYTVGDNGWHSLSGTSYLFRYLFALVFLLPITFLMGGTLSLLIRYLVRGDVAVAGVRVGVLYGINTAGAAVGAFMVDFSLVPTLGIFATQSVAVLINLTVGLVALRWAAAGRSPALTAAQGRGQDGSSRPMDDKSPTPGPGLGAANRFRWILPLNACALFLSGFAAMGLEIIWFRYLRILMGGHRATFSLLLTVILLAIWLGSTVGGAVHRKVGNAARLFILTQGAFVLSALISFYVLDFRAFGGVLADELAAGYPTQFQRLYEVLVQVKAICWVVAIPAFLMGFSFPLANASVQRAEDSVGRKAGLLYLANTVGALAGSLSAGFLLLPLLGLQSSLIVVAGCGLAVAIPLYISLAVLSSPEAKRNKEGSRFVAGFGWITLAAGVVMIVVWLQQPWFYLPRKILRAKGPAEKMVAFSEGISETLTVIESAKTRRRWLITNGHPMSATSYQAQRYMRAFVHIPMLQMENPKKVLVICFGVGNTLHAASLHSTVERLELAELSRNVLEHAGYFKRWNQGVLQDKRLSVFINDGRQHLRMQRDDTYDLITLEPPPIAQAGVSSLYSVEFYELAKQKLREGGHLTQWLPVYQVHEQFAAAVVHAFVATFPDAVLLSGHRDELILMGRKGGPPIFDPRAAAKRLAQQPTVLKDLRHVDLGTMTELVGTFAGGSAELRRTADKAMPVTDDLPIMEYGPMIYQNTIIPASLFSPQKVGEWCPSCPPSGTSPPDLSGLPAYLSVMEAYYGSKGFLEGSSKGRPVRKLKILTSQEAVEGAIQKSGYLKRLFGYGK